MGDGYPARPCAHACAPGGYTAGCRVALRCPGGSVCCTLAAGRRADVVALHVADHAAAPLRGAGRAAVPTARRRCPTACRRTGSSPVRRRRTALPSLLSRADPGVAHDAGGAGRLHRGGSGPRGAERVRQLHQGPRRAGVDGRRRRVRRAHAGAVGRTRAGGGANAALVPLRHARGPSRGGPDPASRRRAASCSSSASSRGRAPGTGCRTCSTTTCA